MFTFENLRISERVGRRKSFRKLAKGSFHLFLKGRCLGLDKTWMGDHLGTPGVAGMGSDIEVA